jgi:hypothetical protein
MNGDKTAAVRTVMDRRSRVKKPNPITRRTIVQIVTTSIELSVAKMNGDVVSRFRKVAGLRLPIPSNLNEDGATVSARTALVTALKTPGTKANAVTET